TCRPTRRSSDLGAPRRAAGRTGRQPPAALDGELAIHGRAAGAVALPARRPDPRQPGVRAAVWPRPDPVRLPFQQRARTPGGLDATAQVAGPLTRTAPSQVPRHA